MFPEPFQEITVTELAQRLAEPESGLQLIDVREPAEVGLAAIAGFQIFPLSQFREWETQILENLDPHQETIVLCHHGIRSAQMCQWLAAQGFTNIKNVMGGIDAYAQRIDPSIPRY
jgi:rhodanese-related sulfurtransferase